jgi:hypothetical protein
MKTTEELAHEMARKCAENIIKSGKFQDLYPHLNGKALVDLVHESLPLTRLIAVARAAEQFSKADDAIKAVEASEILIAAIQSLRTEIPEL